MNRVEDLETAILNRAKKLADEYKERADRRRASILKEAAEHLRLREEQETTAAKAQAELVYLRKVQASEIKLKASMDHLRWSLVQEIEQRMADKMREYVEQEDAYLKTLQAYITQGAELIERNELIAEVNSRDHQRLVNRWESLVAEAAPNKRVTLAAEPIQTIGGTLIRSEDGRIRLDNTFEGRIDRLRPRLHQIVVESLIPATMDGGGTSL
jgi:V/A-type H+-transporting ATPase subunit E